MALRHVMTTAAVLAALTAVPAGAQPRTCPLVADAAGDVTPGLVVAPAGDEPGLDILAADVSVGPVRTGTTVWLEQLDDVVPLSGEGDYYYVMFRIGQATLYTRVWHYALAESFDAGWIDEDGAEHYFSAGRAAGSYDPELDMVRVSFDNVLLAEDPIPGDPVIRKGTLITDIRVEARRATPGDDSAADAATSKATYRVGQGSCPPYRLALRT
jgi:hypothetical protein